MMHASILHVNPAVSANDINALRAAVGWQGLEQDYPAALGGYWAYIGGFDEHGKLIAWCAVLSDGVRHAVLLDVIVHPAWQRQGIGRALVHRAIEHCLANGITIIHVDFLPEHAAFYEQCGFRPSMAGIYQADDE